MKISVIIPTYRRTKELGRCIEALRKQARAADQLLIVKRDDDEETRGFLEEIKSSYPALRIVTVKIPGQIAALNSGLSEAEGDIVVFTDDDTIPHIDWLRRIEGHFQSSPKTGGVGGRDQIYLQGKLLSGRKKTVGRILWFGEITGNHHLGFGQPREVDHLKGTNMSFRSIALEKSHFDENLRGEGAQYRNDMALCLTVKRKGWKLIYDPAIVVEHYMATRYEEDQRNKFNLMAVKNGAHNEIFVFLKYLPLEKRIMCILFAVFVGSLFTPGIIQWLRLIVTRQKTPWLRFRSATQGWYEGWKTHRLQTPSK